MPTPLTLFNHYFGRMQKSASESYRHLCQVLSNTNLLVAFIKSNETLALKPMIVHVRRQQTCTESRPESNSGSDITTPQNKPKPQHPFHDIDVDAYMNEDPEVTQIRYNATQEEYITIQPQVRHSVRVSISQINPLKLLRHSAMPLSDKVIDE